MTYTYKNDNDYSLLPEGDYECVIELMEETTIVSTGTPKVSVKLRVRDDVEQGYQNRVLFDDIWKEKENKQFYNQKKINRILGAIGGVSEGQEFAGIEDVCKFCTGGYLIAHVVIEHDTYNDKDINRIKWYASSKNKPAELGSQKSVELEDPDLPF